MLPGEDSLLESKQWPTFPNGQPLGRVADQVASI
jgi:hypothetical protein